MNTVARDRVFALCMMTSALALVIFQLSPGFLYGNVNPIHTGTMIQAMVAYSWLVHVRTALLVVLPVLTFAGLYGLHQNLRSRDAGDLFSSAGIIFLIIAVFANAASHGINPIIVNTMTYGAGTSLTADQAIYYSHFMLSVGYSLVIVAAVVGSLGFCCLALGFADKGLFRYHRPIALVIAAASGLALFCFIASNFMPNQAVGWYVAARFLFFMPVLWVTLLGVYFWKNAGMPAMQQGERAPL